MLLRTFGDRRDYSDRETERSRYQLIASSLWSLWSQGLKVSETVDGSANFEILRVAQDDMVVGCSERSERCD